MSQAGSSPIFFQTVPPPVSDLLENTANPHSVDTDTLYIQPKILWWLWYNHIRICLSLKEMVGFFRIFYNRLCFHSDVSLLRSSSTLKAKGNNELKPVRPISIWPTDGVAPHITDLLNTEWVLRDPLVILWARILCNSRGLCTTWGQCGAFKIQEQDIEIVCNAIPAAVLPSNYLNAVNENSLLSPSLHFTLSRV